MDACDALAHVTDPAHSCGPPLSAAHRIIHLALPTVRAYVRWAPTWLGRRLVWHRLAEPYFAWHSRDFRARLVGGGRLGGNQRDLLPKCAYWFGVWEPVLSGFLKDALKPGDGFLDVGANVGYFSVLAAHRVGPHGFVVAVEPFPPLLQDLCANVALNRLRNVRIEPVAAGCDDREIPFFYAGDPNRGESTTVPSAGFGLAARVRQRPLGALLSDDELARVRVVKIDVEGAELRALQGLEPQLERLRHDAELVVELHPDLLAAQGRHVSELAELLAPHGFHPYELPLDFGLGPLLDAPPPTQPARLERVPERAADIVFSRRDANHL